MERIQVLAPAKLNLALDVTGRMPNGYHALDMVMQTVTLWERLTLRPAATLCVTMPGSGVPVDESNTAVRAAHCFAAYTGVTAGALIAVEKHVPVQAGMGGGSADAAGVLVGLNTLHGTHLSMSELCALGAEIGADVPFALMGGTCRVQGVGDLIRALPPLPDCRFVIAMPDAGVSTPKAFAAYDRIGSAVRPDCEKQEQAIRAGSLADVCAAAGNALEQSSGTAETVAIRTALDAAGALASSMTGSGAAVFGVFEREAQARAAQQALAHRCRRVYLAAPDRGGARVKI
jgi:4-diphosphocytidyl-2-C-methyl-D-erythritol kinase